MIYWLICFSCFFVNIFCVMLLSVIKENNLDVWLGCLNGGGKFDLCIIIVVVFCYIVLNVVLIFFKIFVYGLVVFLIV